MPDTTTRPLHAASRSTAASNAASSEAASARSPEASVASTARATAAWEAGGFATGAAGTAVVGVPYTLPCMGRPHGAVNRRRWAAGLTGYADVDSFAASAPTSGRTASRSFNVNGQVLGSDSGSPLSLVRP